MTEVTINNGVECQPRYGAEETTMTIDGIPISNPYLSGNVYEVEPGSIVKFEQAYFA